MFTVYLRGLHRPDAKALPFTEATPLAALRLALKHAGLTDAEPVLKWEGSDQLAALDMDFHDGRSPIHMDNLPCFAVPSAAITWRTHGGGLRLIYSASDPFTAGDLASLSAFSLKPYCPGATFETLDHCRHPAYPRGEQRCGEVHDTGGDGSCGRAVDVARGIMAEYREPNEDQVEEWLADAGMERGKRYPHERCPIEPSNHGRNDPVVVLDYGVYCHRCAATGSGFASWGRLVGGEVTATNRLRLAVRGKSHWAHAKHVVAAETGWTGGMAKELYGALLKAQHVAPLPRTVDKDGTSVPNPALTAAGKLVDMALSNRVQIVRGNGCWLQNDLATPVREAGLSDIFTGFAAVHFPGDKGRLQVDTVRRGELRGAHDLSTYGFPAVTPIHGVDLAGAGSLIGADVADIRVSVPAKRYPFKYVPPAERLISYGPYESHFDTYFPGVNLDAVRLLIGALAFAQTRTGEAPMIFISGQSGAAKTRHAELAVVACGVPPVSIAFTLNSERLKQAYGDASRRGGLAIFNEMGKHLGKSRAESSDVVAALNSLCVGELYHALYVGPVAIDVAVPVVMTDTFVPDAFNGEIQLGRRVVVVPLGAGLNSRTGQDGKPLDWRATSTQNGASGILDWRTASADNAKACDCLVSDTIDRLQTLPQKTFHSYAATLGFATLAERAVEDDGCDHDAVYRELFDAACSHDPLTNVPGSHFRTDRGWLVFNPSDDLPLARSYLKAVGLEDVQFGIGYRHPATADTRIQKLAGQQWGQILGVAGVELDVEPHGKQIGLRFRLGPRTGCRAKVAKFNGEIVNCANRAKPCGTGPETAAA
jgi:hypothetical protein